MPPVPQHVLNWLYSILTSEYYDVNRTYSDVANALSQYPSLSPRTDVHTYDNGTSALLLHLTGTVPVVFRGNTYRFPISVRLPHAYPREAPLVYVTPTETMVVRPGQHVDPQGQVYHPYLAGWSTFWDKSTVLDFLAILRDVFAKEPPVIARQNRQPSAAGEGQQQQQQPQPQPHQQQPNPTPPPLPPPPTELAGHPTSHPQSPATQVGGGPPPPPPPKTSEPNSYRGTPQNPNGPTATPPRPGISEAGPPPPPRPPQEVHGSQRSSRYDSAPPLPHEQQQQQQQPPYYAQQPPSMQPQSIPQTPSSYADPRQPPPPGWQGQGPTQAYQPGQPPYNQPTQQQQLPPPQPKPKSPPPPNLLDEPLTLNMPSQSNLPPPPIPPNPEKDALLHQLAQTLHAHRQSAHQQNTSSLAGLRAQKAAMIQASGTLQSEMSALSQTSALLANNTNVLHDTIRRADAAIEGSKRQTAPDVDDLLVAPTVVANQLYNLVAEEKAMGDAIFMLGRAVERGRISPAVFAKTTRSLAREWYLKKALARKIAKGMGLTTT